MNGAAVFAHASADPAAVATAIVRGGYEYQGQKCSAASRIYVEKPVAEAFKKKLVALLERMRLLEPEWDAPFDPGDLRLVGQVPLVEHHHHATGAEQPATACCEPAHERRAAGGREAPPHGEGAPLPDHHRRSAASRRARGRQRSRGRA